MRVNPGRAVYEKRRGCSLVSPHDIPLKSTLIEFHSHLSPPPRRGRKSTAPPHIGGEHPTKLHIWRSVKYFNSFLSKVTTHL